MADYSFGSLRDLFPKKKKKKRADEDVGKGLEENKALQEYNLKLAKKEAAEIKAGTRKPEVSKDIELTEREETVKEAAEGLKGVAKGVGKLGRKIYKKTLKKSVEKVLSDAEGIKKYGKKAWERMKKQKSI
ncbi:MAG: hypothetical protein KAV87_28110 [Desulfobacteraceae bacterium]|nr:hypothetical protein [Desulfobacteraceae bacterium]